VLYRSPRPLLEPQTESERAGIVDNVVFPTGIDPRPDLGARIFDTYYGMADFRVGAAASRCVDAVFFHRCDPGGWPWRSPQPRTCRRDPASRDSGIAPGKVLAPPKAEQPSKATRARARFCPSATVRGTSSS